jgi:hypothetical protein
VIVNPDLYEKYRKVINREKFLRVDGVLQNQDGVISVKATQVSSIAIGGHGQNPMIFTRPSRVW